VSAVAGRVADALERRPVSDAHVETLKPYVPRLLIEWVKRTPEARYRSIEGSLVFVDISGFTALTERLAKKGKVGAELMRDTLDGVFTALLDEAYDWGAGLLKWGGDALLLFFDGPLHAERAARAAWEMQRTIDRVGRLRVSGGTVVLRMSIGISTGAFDFFTVGSVHRELLIAGPKATETVTIEAIADAGEIGLSRSLAAVLAPTCIGPGKQDARLLVAPPEVERNRAPDVGSVRDIDVASCIPVAARAHVLLERSEPEHRTITAAFIDLMDTDLLLEQIGPDALGEALDQRIRVIEEAALQYEVPFYETDIGKGSVKALLTAGAPSSTGHDEERMLRALREIMDAPGVVPMRIGVNRGKVFTGDFGPPYRRAYRVFGDAINTAARVMSKAEAGQVLSTEIVLNRSRTTFETTPIEPFQAKGKAEPVRASIVGPVIGTKDARRAEVALVGREAELSALLRVIDDVRTGNGWIIEISGEPGLGKSRLVEELMERARDLVVLHSRCEEYESSTPYYALRAPLRAVLGVGHDADSDETERRLRLVVARVDPTLEPWIPLLGLLLGLDLVPTAETRSLDPRFIREQLADVAMRFLVSTLAGTPTMLAVEDVHFMDEASTDLLGRLSRAGSDLRQVLLVTHSRPGERWAPDADDLRCLSLCLLPLPPARMAEMVELLTEEHPLAPHDTEEIARRSGGNALFLFELLETVRATGSVDSLPDSVESLVAGEIDRLSPLDRTVLRYASILGTSFDPVLLESAVSAEVELDGDVWTRLAELVNPEPGGTMRFRNTLIRDAAYEGLPYRRRRELHGRVGLAIEATAGTSLDEEIGALARHFHAAGLWGKAWEYCRRAGDRALRIYANVDAARFYEQAVASARHLRSVDAVELGSVYERLGDATKQLAEFDRSLRALRAARTRFSADPAAASRTILTECRIAELQGRHVHALRTATRGIRLLEGVPGADAAEQRAALSMRYAGVLFRRGRLRDAVRWCERSEAEAKRAGAATVLARAYVIHDLALITLGDSSGSMLEAAVAIFEEQGELDAKASALNNMAFSAYVEGRWEAAAALFADAKTTWEAAGRREGAALPTYNTAEILFDRGLYDDAGARLREALRVWRASGSASEIAEATRLLGRLETRRGDIVLGRELLEQARAEQLRAGEQYEVVGTDARIAECLVTAGETSEARALVSSSLERAAATEGGDTLLPLLWRVDGWALALEGDRDGAAAAFERSLRLARGQGSDYEVAMALDGLAYARGARRPEAVADLVAERDALLERLGVVHTLGDALRAAHGLEVGRADRAGGVAATRPV
jgi:class 3 adenylate cyclase/tetratricopeptide (TPR) repeat protein